MRRMVLFRVKYSQMALQSRFQGLFSKTWIQGWYTTQESVLLTAHMGDVLLEWLLLLSDDHTLSSTHTERGLLGDP